MLSTVDTRAADAPPPSAVRRRRGFVLIALLVLGWALHVALRLWLARVYPMPLAHSDEDSYLNTARVIAGGPAGFTNENELLRRVGYPLLISPAYLVTQDFLATYRIVHVINACLNAAAFPLAYLICRRMLALPRTTSYAAAFAAAALPAVAWWSGFAMTDAVLAPLLLAWLVTFQQWLSAPERIGWAIGAGAAVGAIYSIHIRGVVIVAVSLLVVGAWALRKGLPRRPLLAFGLAMALLGAVSHVADAYIGDRMPLLGRAPGGQTVSALLSVRGLAQFSYTVVSQLWYLVVITLGLGGIAWWAAVRELRRKEGDVALRWTYAAALLATVGIAVGAAFILAGVPLRSSGALYARYIHMTVPFWFLVGVAAVLRLPTPRLVRFAAVTVAGLLVSGGLVALRIWWAQRSGTRIPYGVFGAPDLMALTFDFDRPRPLIGTAIAVAGCVLLVAVTRSSRVGIPVLVALLAVNVFCLYQVTEREVRPIAQRLIPTPTLARLGVHGGDRVVALAGFDWRVRMDLAHQVTWADVPVVKTPPADADVVLAPWQPGSPKNWDGTAHGLRMAGGNRQQAWAVWLRP